MKYYTLDKIIRMSKQGGADISIKNNMGFAQGLYNSIRGLFGFQPKKYYLEKGENNND